MTFYNLAFKMKLIQKLIDEKLLMEHTPYSNRPSLSQRQDQQKIFLEDAEDINGNQHDPANTLNQNCG